MQLPQQCSVWIDRSHDGGYSACMDVPLPVKIRALLVMALGAAIFGVIGWPLVAPFEPGGCLTVVLHFRSLAVLGVALGLAVVAAALALLIARPYARNIAQLAVPTGLCAWAVLTGGMDRLLLSNVDSQERVRMFHYLAADAVIWFVPVALGSVIVLWICEKFGSYDASKESGPAKTGGHTAPAASDAQVGLVPTAVTGHVVVRHLVSLGVTCLVAGVLLPVFARSGRAQMEGFAASWFTVTPDKGQVVFALIAAFGLAAFASHQLFAAPLWCLLLSCPVVAIWVYVGTAHTPQSGALAEAGAHFLPVGRAYAGILPVQYIAVGALAIILGRWCSTATHFVRHHRIG